MTRMFELKSSTFVYIYTDGKKVFITEEAPVQSDDKKWYHKDIDTLRCIQTLFIDSVSHDDLLNFEEE